MPHRLHLREMQCFTARLERCGVGSQSHHVFLLSLSNRALQATSSVSYCPSGDLDISCSPTIDARRTIHDTCIITVASMYNKTVSSM